MDNKYWYIHTMKYYAAIKTNQLWYNIVVQLMANHGWKLIDIILTESSYKGMFILQLICIKYNNRQNYSVIIDAE